MRKWFEAWVRLSAGADQSCSGRILMRPGSMTMKASSAASLAPGRSFRDPPHIEADAAQLGNDRAGDVLIRDEQRLHHSAAIMVSCAM